MLLWSLSCLILGSQGFQQIVLAGCMDPISLADTFQHLLYASLGQGFQVQPLLHEPVQKFGLFKLAEVGLDIVVVA